MQEMKVLSENETAEVDSAVVYFLPVERTDNVASEIDVHVKRNRAFHTHFLMTIYKMLT
jgi:hypothetical protein